MILLDTHAWTCWLHPELGSNLTPPIRRWIEESDETLAVSVHFVLGNITTREKRYVDASSPLPRWFDLALDTAGITCLLLNPALLYASVGLPEIHKYPADRIIITTAQYYDAWLVTRDENI